MNSDAESEEVDELFANSKELVAGLARGTSDAKHNFDQFLGERVASCGLQTMPNLIDSRYESKVSFEEPNSGEINLATDTAVNIKMFKSLGT